MQDSGRGDAIVTSQHERQLTHRWWKPRLRALWRHWASASLMVLLAMTLTLPALAYLGSGYGWHDGTYCGWDGANEHWDYNSPTYDYVGGTTGLQYGYPDECDRTRLKIYWEPYGETARLEIWSSGSVGVNSGVRRPAEFLFYSDHDVRRGSWWYGFRVNH